MGEKEKMYIPNASWVVPQAKSSITRDESVPDLTLTFVIYIVIYVYFLKRKKKEKDGFKVAGPKKLIKLVKVDVQSGVYTIFQNPPSGKSAPSKLAQGPTRYHFWQEDIYLYIQYIYKISTSRGDTNSNLRK